MDYSLRLYLAATNWPRRVGLLAAATALLPAAFGQAPTFAPVATYAAGAGSGPYNVVVADVNGDGKPDALTTNNTTSTLGVLLGNGSGSFTLQANSPSTGASGSPYGLAVADVNGDGKPDALVTNQATATLGVLLGNGSGGFTLQANSPSTGAGSRPVSVAVADVNGDGQPDALVANYNIGTIMVLLGNGSGSFTPQASSPSIGSSSFPYSLVVADVNGDGKRDILTANSGASTLGVLLGNGNGGFTLQTPSASTGAGSAPYNLAVADVNGDGKADVLTANYAAGTLGVLLGNGNGGFTLQASSPVFGAGSYPYSVAIVDLNGDGKPDALTANQSSNTLGVLLGDGNGGFALQANSPATGASSRPIGFAVADVNGDGKPDVLLANYGTNTLNVLLNTTPLATLAALPGTSATLAPNPAQASSTLTATGLPTAAHTVAVTLCNALGQVVRRLTLPAAAGTAQAELPTAGLPAGLYLLHLAARDGRGGELGVLLTQRLAVE